MAVVSPPSGGIPAITTLRGRVAYGAWRLLDERGFGAKDHLRLIEWLLDMGVETFDHADIYGDGRALEVFGAALALAPSLRKRLRIVFKAGIRQPASVTESCRLRHYDSSDGHLQAALDTALGQLGTDHVDAFVIHRPDPLMEADETGVALARMAQAGQALTLGVSNFNVHQVELLAARVTIDIHQLELSPLVTRALDDGTLEQCQRLGLTAMAYSPLGLPELLTCGDPLATRVRDALDRVAARHGVSRSAISLAWVLRHPSVPMAILGSRRTDRILDALEGLRVILDREEWQEIRMASQGD